MGGADVDMSNTSQNTSPGRVLGPLINEHSCPSRTQIPIGLKMFAFELEKPHLQDPHVACLSLQAGNVPLLDVKKKEASGKWFCTWIFRS